MRVLRVVHPDVGYPGPHSEVASPKRSPYLAPDPGRRLHLISFEICLVDLIDDFVDRYFNCKNIVV